jgi:hypothetical protein
VQRLLSSVAKFQLDEEPDFRIENEEYLEELDRDGLPAQHVEADDDEQEAGPSGLAPRGKPTVNLLISSSSDEE